MSAAARHVRRQWPHVEALGPGDPVPSPCNSVCRIDPDSGLCEGCLRTVDEVTVWSALSDASKRAVWHDLLRRAAAVEQAK